MIGLVRSWLGIHDSPSVYGRHPALPKPKVAGSTPVVRFAEMPVNAGETPAVAGLRAEGHAYPDPLLHGVASRRMGVVGAGLVRCPTEETR